MLSLSFLLNSRDFVSLITSTIDFLVVTIIAISIIQAITPLMKVMIRTLVSITNPSPFKRQLQEQNYLFEHSRAVAKKNLLKGLLLGLELESASAILKMGVFSSFIIGSLPSSEVSSASIMNNFLFFIAILSLRIGINQGLQRFGKSA